MKAKYKFNYSALKPNKPWVLAERLVWSSLFAALVYTGITKSFDDNSEEIYGSRACAESAEDLNDMFEFAVANDNQDIIQAVLNEVENYQNGLGDNALGDQCTFPNLSN